MLAKVRRAGGGARRMACALLLAAVAAGCAKAVRGVGSVVDPLAQDDSVALRLILIGDGGLPEPDGEPVLTALEAELARDPERHLVVWLGDNVYPVGLSDTTTEAGRTGLAILASQMGPMRRTGTRGLFIPGNHDWANGAPEGWANVVRQSRYVNDVGDGLIALEPRDGCPGPVVMDMGPLLRLIAIDTHWWLHASTRPGPDRCTPGTAEGVIDSLRVALGTAGDRRTVVVAHHPLASGGSHGGYFDWPTYIFPLHPWARQAGLFARQDVTGREYREMAAALARAFVPNRPLVYAAGHEHNLQVFRRDPAQYMLVSGAGIYGHTSPTRSITGTRYTRQASGWQRLTFLHDGRVRLAVIVVDARGNATEDFSMWLDAPDLSATRAARAGGEGAR